MSYNMIEEQNRLEALCSWFGLRNQQMRSDLNGFPFAKNQWWFIDEEPVGYGDLSQDDVIRIAELLEPGRTFTTFNEYDGIRAREAFLSPFEMTQMFPRLIITCNDIQFPQGH